MPGTTLTLHIRDGLSEKEKEQLRLLLKDALGEFQTHRGPTPAEYVDRRYPAPKYDWVNRPEKIQEVTERVTLASKLHGAVDASLKIEDDPPNWYEGCPPHSHFGEVYVSDCPGCQWETKKAKETGLFSK